MKRIGMGLVGAGFVGPHHVDAVRRLGFVDIVAVAGSTEASGRQKAEALGARRGYGSYQALIDDPDVQVVHNATPNYLHYEVTSAALAKGQARRLGQAAGDDRRGVEAAGRRGEARRRRHRRHVQLPRQPARAAGAAGDRARRHRHAALSARPLPAGLAAQGDRLLVAARSGEGRRVVGARRHRLALVRPGAAPDRPDASRTCSATSRRPFRKRKKPRGSREAFQTAGGGDAVDVVDIRVEDLASVLVRFDNGAKGSFSVGQVCAGHKNDLVLEVCGSKASVRWRQEHQNELWSATATARTRSCRRTRR